jgi:hypothetical protein
LASTPAGDAYETITAQGDRLSGTVIATSSATWHLGITIGELNNAILLLEMEPAADGVRAGFWLSTYGLGADAVSQARTKFETLYRSALGVG